MSKKDSDDSDEPHVEIEDEIFSDDNDEESNDDTQNIFKFSPGKPPKKYNDDKIFFRKFQHYIGVTLIILVGGCFYLAANDKDIPEGIIAALSALIGVIGGIFSKD